MGRSIIPLHELELNGIGEAPAYMRIKILQYTTMVTMYSNIMADYDESLLKYRDKCASLLHQQRILIRKDITSEELESLLEVNNTSLFVDNILHDTKVAKQQLLDIQNRHAEVQKLEKSIVQIRDIISEVAFLIEKQGEQIDSIEFFAGTAICNVEGGRTDLGKARLRKQRYRKRKYKCILLIALVISIFIIFAVISQIYF